MAITNTEIEKLRLEKRRLVVNTFFLIALIVVIILLVFTLVTLIKNAKIIKSDPLTYGMEVHGFTGCQCIDTDGKRWYSEDGGFITTYQNDNYNDKLESYELMINFSAGDLG